MSEIIEVMEAENGPAKNSARKALRVVAAAFLSAAALAFVVNKVNNSDHPEK